MASSIPSVSNKGFQNASSYDQYRPSYPHEAVTRFLEHLQVSGVKGARIVDLAAGTGKFTELLADRDEGFEILAVEPHNGACSVHLRAVIHQLYQTSSLVACSGSGVSLVALFKFLELSYDT